MSSSVLIVGGGLAAQRAAETLRARDHRGPIRVVCGEPLAPYDRPPLSKELDAAPFRPLEWYLDREIDLVLGRRATRLDVGRREVLLDDGSWLAYESLIVATGARPRGIPGLTGRPNVLSLRTALDAAALRGVLVPGARLAVVGAGWIGQEVAATARARGVSVTLIEAAPHIVSPAVSGWFADLHRSEGVRVELSTSVASALPAVAGAPVTSLVLSDGREVEADAVLVGVGVVPDTRWLAGSPLAGDGVVVDEGARTIVPGVYAAGDVVRGCHHWETAARLGAAAARSILGVEPVVPPVESFWSDQYGLRIHLVGSAAGADAVEIDRSSERCFTAALSRHGSLIGALLVDRPRELPSWRRRLAGASTLETRSAA